MIYKVSVLRGTKLKPELVRVTEVVADRFGMLIDGVFFYNDTTNWRGKVTTACVAFLPGSDWVIEQS